MFVALGLTGCIAAYKAGELVRLFVRKGCGVQVAATRHALEFVTPLTLETLSGNPLRTDSLQREEAWEVEHVALARRADVLCVAPATANILAKFAHGIADDFLSTLYLAARVPVVVAPAMNAAMWEHPATRQNLQTLRERGVAVVEPGTGFLACGEEGQGRLADLGRIVEAVFAATTPKSLAGRTVLVTAGPTAEDIDPIRFVSNRSTGAMGSAVAREASRRGARVFLVAGPGVPEPEFPCEWVPVRSAADMAAAVDSRLGAADAGIFSAAVADYTPAEPGREKLKKGEGPLDLRLVRTVDILAREGARKRPGCVLAGFAAETSDAVGAARKKLAAKNADLMVANVVGGGRGFGPGETAVTLVRRDGSETALGPLPKETVAARILDEVERLLPR